MKASCKKAAARKTRIRPKAALARVGFVVGLVSRRRSIRKVLGCQLFGERQADVSQVHRLMMPSRLGYVARLRRRRHKRTPHRVQSLSQCGFDGSLTTSPIRRCDSSNPPARSAVYKRAKVAADLIRNFMRYIRHYNKAAKPVKWKYADPSRRITPESIVTVH